MNRLETVIFEAIILNDTFVKNDGETMIGRLGWGYRPSPGRARSRARFALGVAAVCLGALLSSQNPASAASDNSSNTYAADANGIVIPTGTLLAI
jgi:hypothetical protein